MPRTIHPDLLDCLRRANPYTEYRAEITEPDAVRILRRSDEFLATPPLVGAMVPANSLSADARGGLILSPTTAALANFAGEASFYDLNGEDATRRIKGAAWTMDAAFTAAKLRSVTARVQRVALAGLFYPLDFELQVFRVTKTPGNKEKYVPATQQVQVTAFTDYTFTPLLNPAPVIKSAAIVWDGTQKSTLNFDLTNYGLVLENTPSRAAAPDQAGELPRYYFVVRVLNNPKGTGFFRWLVDNASARTIAGIGTFQRSWWARNNDQEQWVETLFADVPTFGVNVETYPASGAAVYVIDVGKVPATARGSIGRAVFERFLPPGTTAQLDISTAGSGGPWTAIKHGDAIATAQQTYHLRVTLTRDASTRRTPAVNAMGIEWRIPLDVSVESIPQLPTREVALPWPKASIPEGKITVVRTGVRDYLDTASVLGSTQATTKLECDIYLASRHPAVTRDKWLHLERLAVSNRVPGSTSEAFTLLSSASKLKKKIPLKVESLTSVHTVTGGSTVAVTVTPALPGTSVSGNEYDGKGYYMRVRSTSNVNVAVGFIQTIQGNTGTGQLDFTPAMPSALSVGDVIEVHSGIFATQAISWTDADPADVWDQLLAYAGIPLERIGAGYLPRGGKPPRVTDIAPGDATTQAKRKVTSKLTEIEGADELLAQVSAILGGVTMEMPGGQICFVQLFPLRDATGQITVPLPPVVRTFDKRDYGTSLQTPPGLEKRATVMSGTYGVPLTAAAPETYPKQTTVTVDNDALLWLTQQDLEDFGSAQVPDKIARWFYNTADAGLYLAASVTATYVRALSTGLRVFPFNAVEKNPELVPGDSVVILTDQYTDFEPSSGTPLRGMLAVRGVLVQVGNEGRQLAMFVPGLQDNITQAQGGNAGTLTGLGEPLDPPILTGSFDASGQLFITSIGAPGTQSQKIAVGSVEPTDAFTRAGSPIVGQSQTNLASGITVLAGVTLWIKAFAYDAYGNESAVARVAITREGSGASQSPVPFIVPLNTEVDDTVRNLQFSATPGSGGGGANLTYDIRVKVGFAAESSLASGNATTLPRTLSITRHVRSDKIVRFIVTDTATGLSDADVYTIPSQRTEIDDTIASRFTPGATESGAKPINRLYAKALAADPDTADSVSTGTLRRVTTLNEATGGGRGFSGLDTSGDLSRDIIATRKVVGSARILRDVSDAFSDVSPNLLENPGFENAGVDPTDTVAQGWGPVETPGPNFTEALNATVPYSGSKSWLISLSANQSVPAGAQWYNAHHSRQQYRVKVGESYLLRAKIRTDQNAALPAGLVPYAGFWLRVVYTDGSQFDHAVTNRNTPTSSVWVDLESGPVTILAGAAPVNYAIFYFWSRVDNPTGAAILLPNALTWDVRFDNVELVRVSNAASEVTRSFADITPVGTIMQHIANTGHAASTMQESGTKPLNRLYAKALAADPDTLGYIIDDGTLGYRKPLGVNTSNKLTLAGLSHLRGKWHRGINTAVPNNTDTKAIIDTADVDPFSLYDAAGGGFKIPAGTPTTFYLVRAYVMWDGTAGGTNANGLRQFYIMKNGSPIPETAVVGSPVIAFRSASGGLEQVTSWFGELAANDPVQAGGFQNSGGALNFKTVYLEVMGIGS